MARDTRQPSGPPSPRFAPGGRVGARPGVDPSSGTCKPRTEPAAAQQPARLVSLLGVERLQDLLELPFVPLQPGSTAAGGVAGPECDPALGWRAGRLAGATVWPPRTNSRTLAPAAVCAPPICGSPGARPQNSRSARATGSRRGVETLPLWAALSGDRSNGRGGTEGSPLAGPAGTDACVCRGAVRQALSLCSLTGRLRTLLAPTINQTYGSPFAKRRGHRPALRLRPPQPAAAGALCARRQRVVGRPRAGYGRHRFGGASWRTGRAG
jgi:hypothetical protein